MLIRLVVLGGLIITLTGLDGPAEGDSGGELAMAQSSPSLRPKCGSKFDCCVVVREVFRWKMRCNVNWQAARSLQSRCHVAESKSESESTSCKTPFPKESPAKQWWPGAHASLAMMQAS